MTDNNKKDVLFAVDYYAVELLDKPIADPEDPSAPPTNYAIVNTDTDRVECFASFLPAAIQTAEGLNNKLKEYSVDNAEEAGESGSNIVTLH